MFNLFLDGYFNFLNFFDFIIFLPKVPDPPNNNVYKLKKTPAINKKFIFWNFNFFIR